MERMDPLDAAMVTAEPMSQPQHVAAVLILSPPDDARPEYVDELYREALSERTRSTRGFAGVRIVAGTPAESGSGAMLRTSTSVNSSSARHCRRAPAKTASGDWSVSCMPSD